MAAPTDKSKFDLGYLITGDGVKDWWKAAGAGIRLAVMIGIGALLFLGFIYIRDLLFPKPKPMNINKPKVVVTPFAKVETVDQRSMQVAIPPEKEWEVGLGAAGIDWDNRTGGLVGAWVKKKF